MAKARGQGRQNGSGKIDCCLSISHLRNHKQSSPQFWDGHVTDIKRLMFWKSDFITFFQIWFDTLIFHSGYGRLLVKKLNLLNIEPEVLRSTGLKWSGDWHQKADIFKKWLHKFSPNLIWTICFKGRLF